MQINYSIIIPHKNIPQLLQRCLDSIPVRDDVQVIVVDDNSDSNIVDFEHFPQWKGRNYLTIFVKENLYAGRARNKGMAYANGKYLTFVDADDLLSTSANAIFDKYIHSTADVIRLGLERRDCDSLKLLSDDNWYMQTLSDTRLLDVEKMLGCTISAAQFISRDLIDSCKISWGGEKYHEDTMFSTQVVLHCQNLLISDEDFFYVWTARKCSNSSTINHDAIIQHFETDKEKFNFVKKKGVPLSYLGNYQMEHLIAFKRLKIIEQLPLIWEMYKCGMLFNKPKHDPLSTSVILNQLIHTLWKGLKNQCK